MHPPGVTAPVLVERMTYGVLAQSLPDLNTAYRNFFDPGVALTLCHASTGFWMVRVCLS